MRLILGLALTVLALGACDREARRFVKPVKDSDPVAKAEGLAELQPGQEGPGMKLTGAAGGYDEKSAYELSQGKQWFRWYNCVGCHAQGGGAIGPALMDDQWIYGEKPEDIFKTIMDGRPNGMPSFRGRIPEAQAWQLVAYVRSMSGLVSQDAAPNRADTLMGAPPESRRKPQRPDQKGGS
jgi:cytochrome c oxidase cbb3-type subunit III